MTPFFFTFAFLLYVIYINQSNDRMQARSFLSSPSPSLPVSVERENISSLLIFFSASTV